MYWINGIPQAQLSINDRSIHFGDGFFTTAKFFNGEIHLLAWHIERLVLAGKRLLFAPFDIDILRYEMQTAIQNASDGVIKVIISRGSSKRGYSFNGCENPQRIILLTSIPAQYDRWHQDGVRLIHSPIRLSKNKLLAGIKHNNRLEQILIRAYLDQFAIDEAIVLDTDGIVVECCSANIFWRHGVKVFTPTIYHAGVAGVMRRHVMTLLPMLGYSLYEVSVGPSALTLADEIFITNSLLPIAPVSTISSKQYTDRTLYLKLKSLC